MRNILKAMTTVAKELPTTEHMKYGRALDKRLSFPKTDVKGNAEELGSSMVSHSIILTLEIVNM